jgi:anti-sigma factor RsiW
MPVCVDQELLLGGLIDGELDAANTALTEAHAARCEGCREELERLQALHNLLGRDEVRHRAPETLVRRIHALPELSGPPARRSMLPGWLAPGLTGALAASLALVTFVQPSSQSIVDEQLVSSHVRSLQPGHLIDVQTSNQHVVKPWFNGKVDFAPPVPELADRGFPLVGGRLDSIDGKTVGVIVYRRRLHTVNLFVWRSDKAFDGTSAEDGFNLSKWNDGGLSFAAVSDVAPQDLSEFERLYRERSREPATVSH